MRVYKELEKIGFFDWYCTQYGGHTYQEYKPVYDDLPSDNLIRTKLNACVFKFFREKYNLMSVIGYSNIWEYSFLIETIKEHKTIIVIDKIETYEEAELECLKKLISIIKK